MSQWLIALAGAVVSAFLYPLAQWLFRFARARDALKRIFKSSSTVRLVPSYVQAEERANVRGADYRVAKEIGALVPSEDINDTVPFAFSHPAFPLVVIGSTRYNNLAEDFQRKYSLPFEFVVVLHAEDPASRRLSVLTEFGEELVASADTVSHERDSEEVDYAIVLIAMLNDGRKFYWMAGIHSAGTEGAWKYLKEESSLIYKALPRGPGRYVSYLVRVRYTREKNPGKKKLSVEALGSAVRGDLQRRNQEDAPCAILCDLGNVLMDFDRTRSYRAIAHYAGISWEEVRDCIEGCDVRERYESGEIETEKFCDEIYDALGINENVIARPLIKEFWGDIFWLNQAMWNALEYLQDTGLTLVLLSNTNPLHFEGVERDYPDVFDLFSSKILSYEVGAVKPSSEMFQEAIKAVRREVPGCPTSRMIVVDDTAENVEAAKGVGMRALCYRSYPHFVSWVRKNGIYIP